MLSKREFLNDAFHFVLLHSMGIRLTPFTRKVSDLIFRRAVERISDLSLQLDEKLAGGDPSVGVRWILPRFLDDFTAYGAHHIPAQGPLLIIANHPASYDALLISAFVHRPDYKIFIGKITVYDYLPNIARHAIFSPPKEEVSGRMTSLRTAIRHLQDGGSLLIFPRGDIEPDPALEEKPALVMDAWSRSLEIFLRQIPNLQVVVASVSGVIAPKAIQHPFTWFKRKQTDRQRLAYIYQLIQQVLRRNEYFGLHGKVNFSPPLPSVDSLQQRYALLEQSVQKTFAEHIQLFYPEKY